jgi:hypothetical protein
MLLRYAFGATVNEVVVKAFAEASVDYTPAIKVVGAILGILIVVAAIRAWFGKRR